MKTIDIKPGRTIEYAADRAIAESKDAGEPVQFVFNDTTVVVSAADQVQQVIDRYHALRTKPATIKPMYARAVYVWQMIKQIVGFGEIVLTFKDADRCFIHCTFKTRDVRAGGVQGKTYMVRIDYCERQLMAWTDEGLHCFAIGEAEALRLRLADKNIGICDGQ